MRPGYCASGFTWGSCEGTTKLRAKLGRASAVSQSDTQTVKELVGTDLGEQMRTLNKILGG